MSKFRVFLDKIKKGWNEYRRQCTIRECGFDVFQFIEDFKKLKAENKSLKEEINSLKIDGIPKHRYDELVQENKRLNTQLEKFYTLHNDFPSMLRKMWSGSEVVAWIKEQQRLHLSNSEVKNENISKSHS